MTTRGIVFFALGVLLTGAPAAARPYTWDPITVVLHRFINGFNPSGNVETALTACTSQTKIVDEFPPYHWESCADWAAARARLRGVAHLVVTLPAGGGGGMSGKRPPYHAFVVAQPTLTYEYAGMLLEEKHDLLTVELTGSSRGWYIVSWTWANPDGGAECVRRLDNRPCVNPGGRFIDGFNLAGNVKAAVKPCASQTPIFDELPPYRWSSCADWATASARKNGHVHPVVMFPGAKMSESIAGSGPPYLAYASRSRS